CFMLKPYELPVLADRMRTAYGDDSVASTSFITPPYNNEYINVERTNRVLDPEIEVTNLMHRVGIPANISGHQYLREAILMVIEDRGLISGVTKELYPEVAKKYKTTAPKVERAIRHAIGVCWLRGRMDVLESTFGYAISPERGKPTNSEFIAMVADKIRMEMKENVRL
ncbi:MAG: sporulation transcription factor Spo0A, partial [Clostridia bacterium]|nr:sporulation transcription factor Spo0A [Clostridia bacterium]